MTKHLIQIVAHGDVILDEPVWLLSLDVDAYDGRGHARLTHDRSKAQRFESVAAAVLCWKSQSTIRPLRPDGKPNRPLTAYTVTFDKVDDDA